jgi:SAM-dependent methyltransferase
VPISAAWRRWRALVDLDEYDTRWDRRLAEGGDVHGEADFVDGLIRQRAHPRRVLDAGCGTGRVAIELHRRGWETVGVDNDADMLDRARRRAPNLPWLEADLATVAVAASASGPPGADQPGGPTAPRSRQQFDVVVLAGSVLAFVEPADRATVVLNLASHLHPQGALVIGESTEAEGLRAADLDRWADAAGLTLTAAYATWDRSPADDGPYRVAVYQRVPADG